MFSARDNLEVYTQEHKMYMKVALRAKKLSANRQIFLVMIV